MTLTLLFKDELQGFYKSKVMIFLWVGLPVIALLFRFIQVSSSGVEMTFTLISTLLVSSIGGTLAAVMLAVFIINEKNRHVYDLFLIRPLKRHDILLAKFFAVYVCVAIASGIAILVGMVVDFATAGVFSTAALTDVGTSFATSLSMLGVSCGAGVLIGVMSPSVLVGAILVIYGGNQASVIPILPAILNLEYASVIAILLAVIIATVLIAGAVAIFNKKQF